MPITLNIPPDDHDNGKALIAVIGLIIAAAIFALNH